MSFSPKMGGGTGSGGAGSKPKPKPRPLQRYRKTRKFGISWYIKDANGQYIEQGRNHFVKSPIGSGNPRALDAHDRGEPGQKVSRVPTRKPASTKPTHSRITDSHDRGSTPAAKKSGKLPTAPPPQAGKPKGNPRSVSAPKRPTESAFDGSLLDGGAEFLDESLAGKMAEMGYGPAIAALRSELGRMEGFDPEGKIAPLFGAALKALETAALRDKEINAAGQGSMQQATEAILSSIGGADNLGSGVVGAAGAESLGTLKALGTVQEQFNADMVPVIESEKARAIAGARSRSGAQAQDVRLQLAQLLADQGRTRGEGLMDIRRYNNDLRNQQVDRRFALRQYQDQQGQQSWQREMAEKELGLAALMNDVKIADMEVDNRLALTREQRLRRAGWSGLKPGDYQKLQSDLLVSIKAPNGKWRVPMNESWRRVLGIVKSRGLNPNTPQGQKFLAGFANAAGIRLGPRGNPVGRMVPTRK